MNVVYDDTRVNCPMCMKRVGTYDPVTLKVRLNRVRVIYSTPYGIVRRCLGESGTRHRHFYDYKMRYTMYNVREYIPTLDNVNVAGQMTMLCRPVTPIFDTLPYPHVLSRSHLGYEYSASRDPQ